MADFAFNYNEQVTFQFIKPMANFDASANSTFYLNINYLTVVRGATVVPFSNPTSFGSVRPLVGQIFPLTKN